MLLSTHLSLLVDIDVALLDLCLSLFSSLSLGSVKTISVLDQVLAMSLVCLNSLLDSLIPLLIELSNSLVKFSLNLILYLYFWLLGLEGYKTDLLDTEASIFELFKLLRSAESTAERICSLLIVWSSLRVRNAKRAVLSIAISQLHLIVGWLTVLLMTSITEVVSAEAVPEGNRATEHAFPINLFFSMLVTVA